MENTPRDEQITLGRVAPIKKAWIKPSKPRLPRGRVLRLCMPTRGQKSTLRGSHLYKLLYTRSLFIPPLFSLLYTQWVVVVNPFFNPIRLSDTTEQLHLCGKQLQVSSQTNNRQRIRRNLRQGQPLQ